MSISPRSAGGAKAVQEVKNVQEITIYDCGLVTGGGVPVGEVGAVEGTSSSSRP